VYTDPPCEVCNDRPSIGVAAIPGMPVSVAWCRECLTAGAIPWWALVANTSLIGGRQHAAPWWAAVIEATCRHLGRTVEELDREVAENITRMAAEGY
jgi:hypothetical protein